MRKTTVINREKLVEMFVVPLLELVLVLLTYKIVTASQTRSAICHQNQRSAAHKRAGKKRKAIVCVTTIKLISKNDRLPPSSLSTYGSVIYLPLTGAIVTWELKMMKRERRREQVAWTCQSSTKPLPLLDAHTHTNMFKNTHTLTAVSGSPLGGKLFVWIKNATGWSSGRQCIPRIAMLATSREAEEGHAISEFVLIYWVVWWAESEK